MTRTEEKNVNATPAPSEKTTGEKWYDRIKFGAAEAFILVATAGIAYWARHGKPGNKWNLFKRMQDRFEIWMKPLAKTETGKIVAGAAASTMVTFHGGNAFAPCMKWFDNKKKNIVAYCNEKFGSREEVRIGNAKVEAEPRQSWGDVIKGRVAAWLIVFSSFLPAMLIAGKDKTTGVLRFDKYEDWFGKTLAKFTKDGARINAMPITERLAKNADTSKTYKFGRILALDIYATTAAILIWNAISKFSAGKRSRKKSQAEEPAPVPAAPPAEQTPCHGPACAVQKALGGRGKYDSYAGMVTSEKEASHMMGV